MDSVKESSNMRVIRAEPDDTYGGGAMFFPSTKVGMCFRFLATNKPFSLLANTFPFVSFTE